MASRSKTAKISFSLVAVAVVGAATLFAPQGDHASAQLPFSQVLCHNESGQNVKPTGCIGTAQGGLCYVAAKQSDVGFYQDITFQQPFQTLPKVIVTPRNISDQLGCVGGATDLVRCYPMNITTAGFRLMCNGSPIGASCGTRSGQRSLASADWSAFENSPICKTHGENLVAPTDCDSSYSGGLCKTAFYKDITFPTPFSSTPHVVTAPEKISDQFGCVGYATDKIDCYPENITPTGFRVRCSGSPKNSCGAWSGWRTLSKVGYVAKEDTNLCQVTSAHGLESDTCNGVSGKTKCNVPMTKKVTFSKPFLTPPQVVITPEVSVSPGSPCAGGAMDKIVCYAADVTKTDFTAVCTASPVDHSPTVVTVPGSFIPWVVHHEGNHWHKTKDRDEVIWIPTPSTTTVLPAAGCNARFVRVKFGYMAVDAICRAETSSSSSSVSSSSSSISSVASSAASSATSSSRSSAGIPQCSDGIDNDGDGKIDYFDRNCYPNNIFDSINYNPNDNSEA